MAHSRQKRSSQLQSQSDDTLHHTAVPTPEVEVSLVDRMKKRFSTRNLSASDASTDAETNETTSVSPSQNPTVTKKRSRTKTSKTNSLGQKVMQIDKFFSPDTRSNRVFRSPTRFQSKSGLSSSATTASSESDDAAQTRTRRTKTRGNAKRNRENTEDEGSRSQSSVEKSTDDSDHRDDTLAPSISKKRRSDASNSQSSSLEGADEGRQLIGGGRSDEDRGGVSQEVLVKEAGMATQKDKGAKKKGIAVMASGNLEAHMADKEFISNQVRVMSTPFVLESGPRSWMQIWKGQKSRHDAEPLDIPASVMSRVVTKINFHMEDIYQRWLGRQKQRDTLISLDELHKDAQDQNHCSLKMDAKNQASLSEIISSYPSEWPGIEEEGSEEMKERYAALRARLFALSRSLSVTKQQCNQYKSLAAALERINTNLEQSSSLDLKQEVKRTGILVSKVQKKLRSGDLKQKRGASHSDNGDEDGNIQSTNPASSMNHKALVRMLFKSAASLESP